MKFTGKIEHSRSIQAFGKLINRIGRISQGAMMVVKEDGIELVAGGNLNDCIKVNIDLPKELFTNYVFVGRPEDNRIELEIKPARINQFIKANLTKAKSMKMKLTTKELELGKGKEPVLEFQFQIPLADAAFRNRTIIHDVSVELSNTIVIQTHGSPTHEHPVDRELDIENRWMSLCNILQRIRSFGIKETVVKFHAAEKDTDPNQAYLYLETQKGTTVTCWTEFCACPISIDNAAHTVPGSQRSGIGSRNQDGRLESDSSRSANPGDLRIVSSVQVNIGKLGNFVNTWPLDDSIARIKFANQKQLTLIVDDEDLNIQVRISMPHEGKN